MQTAAISGGNWEQKGFQVEFFTAWCLDSSLSDLWKAVYVHVNCAQASAVSTILQALLYSYITLISVNMHIFTLLEWVGSSFYFCFWGKHSNLMWGHVIKVHDSAFKWHPRRTDLYFLDVPPLTLFGNCSCLLVFLNYADKKQKKLSALFILCLMLQIQVH